VDEVVGRVAVEAKVRGNIIRIFPFPFIRFPGWTRQDSESSSTWRCHAQHALPPTQRNLNI
jgi:hypothetical protein